MPEKTPDVISPGGAGPQLREALQLIVEKVLDGLRHGHFRYSIEGEIGPNKRREVVIEAGKSHRFTIPEAELPR